MDSSTLLDRLAEAEKHVATGKAHIAGQRRILAELERGGHDTSTATELLATYLESQRLHEEDRDRLRDELDRLEAQDRS